MLLTPGAVATLGVVAVRSDRSEYLSIVLCSLSGSYRYLFCRPQARGLLLRRLGGRERERECEARQQPRVCCEGLYMTSYAYVYQIRELASSFTEGCQFS